ncbi:MAG: hypothetical protein L0H36_00495 [bacterium]|nr:hypothetical protein [bacterium]MDN5835096.1 hypothetical protein [bacterium]
MSGQLISLHSDRITIKRIGDVFRNIIAKPERIYSRSHINTTIPLSGPVRNIHDSDLDVSKTHPRWTAEYRIRPGKDPAFTMSTTGFYMKSGAEHESMQLERREYLKGVATEIQSALEATKYDTRRLSIRLNVEYATLTVFIDLFERY